MFNKLIIFITTLFIALNSYSKSTYNSDNSLVEFSSSQRIIVVDAGNLRYGKDYKLLVCLPFYKMNGHSNACLYSEDKNAFQYIEDINIDGFKVTKSFLNNKPGAGLYSTSLILILEKK